MNTLKGLNRRVRILIISIFICVVAALGFLGMYFHGIGATSSKSKQVVVEIPHGSSGTEVINILNKKGLINSQMMAKLYLKMNHFQFKSNTYLLNKNMNLKEQLTIIEKAPAQYISTVKFTVVDGQTVLDYASAIAKVTKLNEADILAKWEDKTYLKQLINKYWFLSDEILSNDIYFPLEGYLWPDTYQLTKSEMTIDGITQLMLQQTNKKLSPFKKQINSFTDGNHQYTIHQFLTLASIVQKESPSSKKDQQIIAGILINRLNKPMKLQCDTTVNYANQVTKIAVTYKDLNTDSKYNTYLYEGLPIGPICSLSPKTIQSLLNYQKNDYYFFFATKDSKTIYAKDYDEHQKNINENKWY